MPLPSTVEFPEVVDNILFIYVFSSSIVPAIYNRLSTDAR